MHNGTLLVAHEDIVAARNFRVIRQEMRHAVETLHAVQDPRMAILPADVPGVLALPMKRSRFAHREHLAQIREVALEAQKLALLLHRLVRAFDFLVQISKEFQGVRIARGPVADRILDYHRPGRVGVRTKFLPGQVRQDQRRLNTPAIIAIRYRSRQLPH